MATKSISQISTLDDDSAIDVPALEAVKAESADAALAGAFVHITIHSNSDENGNDAVPVGLNGYLYQIPRDKPFKVPSEVAQILKDAVVTGYKSGPNGSVVERSTPRYAFSLSAA